MPYERTTIRIDVGRDPSRRYLYHDRNVAKERTPTVQKGGWIYWDNTDFNGWQLLDTGEWSSVYCLFVENASGDDITINWHDGSAARTAELEAGKRFYTEGVSNSGRVFFSGLATGQAATIYYYTSGLDT